MSPDSLRTIAAVPKRISFNSSVFVDINDTTAWCVYYAVISQIDPALIQVLREGARISFVG